jgi:hypothetical protein
MARPDDARGGGQGVGPAPDGRVDLATAARIVEAAVRDATNREDPTARIVAARVDAAARRAARRNRLLGLGLAATVLATGLAAAAVFRSQRAARELATEAGLGLAPAAPASGSIPTEVLTGRAIYERNRGALYVMGYTSGNVVGGCCSAFAIAPDLLATNAHCVRECGTEGQRVVTLNDSSGRTRFRVVAARMHPGYRPDAKSSDSPDVGLLRIDGRAPQVVTLASGAELAAIGPGDDVFVLGFPGRVMDPVSPSATFLSGHVGRVTAFDGHATTAARAYLVQHDAVTRGGNSGSPVFNQYGHVIAVHAAHVDEEADVRIDGKTTKVTESSPFRLGMRIDLLQGVTPP